METSSRGVAGTLFYNYKRSDKGWGWGVGRGGVYFFFLYKLYSVAENRRTWRTKPVINHHLLKGVCTSAAWRGSSCKALQMCPECQGSLGTRGARARKGGRCIRASHMRTWLRAEMAMLGCWDGLPPSA